MTIVVASGPAEEVAALRTLLANAAPAEVGTRIGLARDRWPDNLGLLLLHGSWHEKSGTPAEAEACYQTAARAHLGNPWPHVRLTELYLRQRRTEDAAAVFREHVWTGSAPEATRIGLLSRTTQLFAQPALRRAFLTGLLRGNLDDRFVLLKLAALAFRTRAREEAERLFTAARALGPLPVDSRLLAVELHLAAARFEEAYALAIELHTEQPNRPDFARRAIQAAHFCGRLEEMIDRLANALRRWPRDWLLVFRYNRCTIPLPADRALFAILWDHAEAMCDDERWVFQFAIACLRHCVTDRALSILGKLSPTGPVADMAMPLRAALGAHPRATWDTARGIGNDPMDDVQIVRINEPIATVIVLAGVQGGIGYLPFSHTDGLLAKRPVNVIYLRDLNNRGFTQGVRRFGTDQAATITALSALCRGLGAPVVTMGASIGGVAAIRTAALMHAHAAISFAGPIHLGAAAEEESGARTGGGTRDSLFSAFTQANLSILALIRSAPRTRIHQCFGAGYAPDIESAALLCHEPNTILHPVTGCADHFVIEHMIAGPDFLNVLDQAIRMMPP